MSDVTRILSAIEQGDPHAAEQLLPLVYDELRKLAAQKLAREGSGQTLQPTALVHETYLRLVKIEQVEWRDRAHFFAVAARVMRRVLIDYARARRRDKRGGAPVQVPLSETLDGLVQQPDDLLALEEVLARLEARNERQCRVVECRCFAGMSVEETAAALDTSPATVKRDWAFARAWLNRELGQDRSERAEADGSERP